MAGHTMSKAARSEAMFIMVASEEEWEIAKPFHHSQGYDFVIRRSKSRIWETVQVKSAFAGYRGRKKLPARAISLRRCNEKGSRPYLAGEYDLLFAVDGDSCWLISWAIIESIRSQILIDSTKYSRFQIR